MNATPPPVDTRPRVEGEREMEILKAALEVLADVGYDRLTMDAVATRAKASKATLYRRWKTKSRPGRRGDHRHEGRRRSSPTPGACAATCSRRSAACGGLDRPRRSQSDLLGSRHHGHSPATRSSRGLPTRLHRTQDRRPRAPSTSGPGARRDPSRRRPRPDLAPALAGIVLHRVVHPRRDRRPRNSSRGSSTRSSCPPRTRPHDSRHVDTTTHPPERDTSRRTDHDRRPLRPPTRRPRHGHAHLGWALVLISHRPADGGARRHHRQHRAALHRSTTSTSPRRTCPGSSPATRSPSAACCCSAAASATSTAAAGSSWSASSVFAVASLLGGLAQNEGMLLGARGLQGLGAALASPAALALITTTFPAGPQRNRAFAVYAAMSGVGAAVGLILGGWLTGLDQPRSASTSTAGG